MNMLGLFVRIANKACYWKFLLLHCIRVLVSPGFSKRGMSVLRILSYNSSLDTWTVVSLTTTKFTPLIFLMPGFAFPMILSRIEYVTRRISSLCQECSNYLLRIHLYTSVATVPRLLSSSTVIPRLLIYLRALLLNEPFVLTVDTPVRITVELLLLPKRRSSVFPWKCLF
jgi:hypothetical protein